MSKDICDNRITNIWHISQMTLPYTFLIQCACLITQQNTKQPKLAVFGGKEAQVVHGICLEYELYDILGYDIFNSFMTDAKQVCFFISLVFSQQNKLYASVGQRERERESDFFFEMLHECILRKKISKNTILFCKQTFVCKETIIANWRIANSKLRICESVYFANNLFNVM